MYVIRSPDEVRQVFVFDPLNPLLQSSNPK
jgi:hypothetical protein